MRILSSTLPSSPALFSLRSHRVLPCVASPVRGVHLRLPSSSPPPTVPLLFRTHEPVNELESPTCMN